jgi:hypothetical protein
MTEDLRPPEWRRAQRVLSMVAELHKRGYQRLRISPGMSNVGSWRCAITSADNIRPLNGAMVTRDDDDLVARYLAPTGSQYFGWSDASGATARDLARLFLERFPDICSRGLGRDWSYAGWFVEVLGVAEGGRFPVAYTKSDGLTLGGEDRPSSLVTTSIASSLEPVELPPPPLVGE